MLTILTVVANFGIFFLGFTGFLKGREVLGVCRFMTVLFAVIPLVILNGFHKKTWAAVLSTLSVLALIMGIFDLTVRYTGGLDYSSMEYLGSMDDPGELDDLLTIYNKYPQEELIVHARVQKDYYKNTPRLETFGEAVEQAKSPVCYNGDIVTADDCTRLQEMFPTLDCIMTGRGTLKNPALAREIRGGAPASKEEIRRFHDMMYNEYCEDLSGDRNILFRMKELWSYLAPMFTNNKKYAKKIKKAEKCVVYENAVRELFGCEQLIGEVSYRCS